MYSSAHTKPLPYPMWYYEPMLHVSYFLSFLKQSADEATESVVEVDLLVLATHSSCIWDMHVFGRDRDLSPLTYSLPPPLIYRVQLRTSVQLFKNGYLYPESSHVLAYHRRLRLYDGQ